ncbi:heavy metal translocating P-type ATPase [Ideonella paludis]|uniref:Cation-translocating P-type ATPase n=1 Tax=Ideonella paludis TaxID=1233411 RepID=A0ABS5DUH3_9BURK|nr:cation-translocating P-type ATPase [Ideonella paludis]MBQ0934795.1 cation-translocating P-type ATPase [Ideonella paludis]
MTATVAASHPHALDVLDDPVEQQRFTRWVERADGSRVADSAFALSGMVCAACAGQIEAALHQVDGVLEARVSASAHSAQVRWDPARTAPSALVLAVRGAGYDAVPDTAASARELRRNERRKALWRLFVASFCAMQVMMFATPSYVAEGAELADDMRQLLNWGSWLVSLPVMLFSAGPFLRGAWHSLKNRKIGMDVPVSLGIVVTFVASSGATFSPGGVFGHEVYFDSLTMFVSFLLGGRFVELMARHRAAESLEAALAAMPESACRLLEDGSEEQVSLHRLRPGDRVRVAMGAAFPADGHLEVGATEADESVLTGESRPLPKRVGDDLVGGSVNLASPVIMRVERVGAETRFEAIVAMMRDALTQRPAMARWADAWAGPFLWVVLVLAAGAAAVWSVIDPSRAVWVAVAVLIVTCPCALSLAAPAAIVAAAGHLARRGVMVQRLDALEAMSRLDRLFLDKTGTLTEDKPSRGAVFVAADGSIEHLGPLASALAKWSSHPLSKALAEDSAWSGQAAAVVWRDVAEVAGQGLQASDEHDHAWRLGSFSWVAPGAARPGWAQAHDGLEVWLGRELQGTWQALACITYDEQMRPDAAAAVAALQHAGIALTLLSGDRPERAHRLSQQLGIADVVAAARPEDKVAAVASAQAKGERVGMLGDGVNDAPVLALADVSLAMGQGALVSRVHADAVVVSNRLSDVVWAYRLSHKAVRIVRQNLIWAATYNMVCIPLALMGYLPPWAAGLGMALSSLAVIGNALRLSYTPLSKAA